MKKKTAKSNIHFNTLASFEDLVPRRGRYGKYVVGFTSGGFTVCMSEQQANKVCLFEPYEMKGVVKLYSGGMYLKLLKASLFCPGDYLEVEATT